MKHSLLVLSSLFALTLGVSVAHADALTSGRYSSFTFGSTGSSANTTFTAMGTGTITVLDGYDDGDQFAVYDNGIFLGNTSAAVNDGTDCGGDTTACYANMDFSRGTFALLAGMNTITIKVILSPYTGGGAFLGENVQSLPATASVAPEPGSLVLLGTGLLGVCGAMRRRMRL